MDITINLDFDGTVVTHDFPEIGKDIGAVPVLKEIVDAGNGLILFTMRSNQGYGKMFLDDAVNWFEFNDIRLYGIQENPTQRNWTSSNKSYATFMIDDSAIGVPLKTDLSLSKRPFVDWVKMRKLLKEKRII